jgi:hypothetical protein
MPEHVSILQFLGVGVLVLAGFVWLAVLARILRRHRFDTVLRRPTQQLGALPGQTDTGPHQETVELTPAERDAFAGLVRQFSDGRG